MLDGGWYKTGDLGYLNDDDYLVVNGRTKDTIKYNGSVNLLYGLNMFSWC